MVNKNDGADPQLRKAIRQKMRAIYKSQGLIHREAVKTTYTSDHPTRARYISIIVEDYADHLEGKKTKSKQAVDKKPAEAKKAGEPSTGPAPKDGFTFTFAPSVDFWPTAPQQALPFRPAAPAKSVSASKDPVSESGSEYDSEDEGSIEYSDTSETDPEEQNGAPDNAILQDFKQHLAGSRDKKQSASTPSVLPSLNVQKQFLSSNDADDEASNGQTAGLENAVLVSAAVESDGKRMPSQFALLGELKHTKESPAGREKDDRVILNTNVPFSAFICGLQGSGKSHTTACIIENCSMTMPALGNLQKSVSTLVLHFNEYSSNLNSQPSEAAFLASVLPKYASAQKPIPLRVLVSPTNYRNLAKMYAHIPNVKVLPFKLQPRNLNISMMLSLMSMSQTDAMPLYMAQVIRVLRQMAMESGGSFDYRDFRRRLNDLRLDRAQTPFLYQRLDLLDSYLDLDGRVTGDYFVDGGVTILDLSCPFVDQSTACILFRIAINLFLHAHPSRGKMIVADEAHKYMTDTSAAKELTETFLTIIRQQRHLGVRTVISTQEPTISPKLIDLCSITIIHRFTSPEWYSAIKTHLPIERSNSTNEHGIPAGLYHIANLQTGEAVVFAPLAHLVDERGDELDTKHDTFRLRIRKRITWDGGRTIVAVR
ncbi:hypothetical protein BJX61DRAFT_539157 [Aspergillus egyptiacus]|nr:hypothetical protein BJX61DRAFT_539157 [Aspergillus egyptiacus]